MPARNYSHQFKLYCVRQVATAQKRPAQLYREHGGLPGAFHCAGEKVTTPEVKPPLPKSSPPLGRKRWRPGSPELQRFCGKLALENEILRRGLERYRSNGGTL
jgi:transposase